MTWTNDLLYGLAQMLNDNGIGTFRTGFYSSSDDTAISLGSTVDESVKAIALFAYGATDSFRTADVMQPVQFRIRGTADATSVDTIGDAIFDLLHGATGLVINGVHTVSIARQSVIPLGRDDSDRWTASHNYYIRANRPSTYRPD